MINKDYLTETTIMIDMNLMTIDEKQFLEKWNRRILTCNW
jgi:hypothetical protein